MENNMANVEVVERKFSVGSIQSYKPISKNASRLLDHMIEHATERYKQGETTHIMSFKEIIGSFGLTMTKDREYIRDKIREIQNLEMIEWDFLGEEKKVLDQIKDMHRDNLDEVISWPSFRSIVETEHFQTINHDRIQMAQKGLTKSKQYQKAVDEILDLLFPVYVGNTKLFESLDLHKSKISFTINRHLVNVFLNPTAYGILDKSVVFQFRSAYSYRLYLNGCIYQYLKSTRWMSIDEAKKMFGVERVTDEHGEAQFRYKTYAPFKQGVIQVAIKECNQFNEKKRIPFRIELEEDNSLSPGKSVDQIRFHIIPDNDSLEVPSYGVKTLLDDNGLPLRPHEFDEIVDRAVALGCNRTVAEEVVKEACLKREATYVDLALTLGYCEEQAKKKRDRGGSINGGYIRNAIAKGWKHDVPPSNSLKPSFKDSVNKPVVDTDSIEKFVNDLVAISKEIVASDERALQRVSQLDPVLQNMLENNRVDPKLVAYNLLRLPEEEFHEKTGMKKSFRFNELRSYF